MISKKREIFDMSQVGLTISRARSQLGIAYQANCSLILASIPIDPRPVKVLRFLVIKRVTRLSEHIKSPFFIFLLALLIDLKR